MRTTGVIVRFLSLLDVVLILLGMFLLLLAQAQIRSDKNKGAAPTNSLQGLAVDFVYLYAGTDPTKPEERGRCFLLGPDRKLQQEVRTDTADDIKKVFGSKGQAEPNRVVMLLVSDKGFDSMWGPDRLTALEKTCGVKVVPVYNVDLSKLRSSR